jgi:HTH-type transcriptional regulator / antitoxin HipB
MATFDQTPIRDPEALGRTIRRRRHERGWTQSDLAARALTDRYLLGQLEAGHETRGVTAIFDTIAALGLELVVRERR